MNTDSLATIYAQALLESAEDKGILDEVLGEVEAFLKSVQDNDDIRIFLESPKLERSKKIASLKSALGGKVSDTFLHFLFLVIDKGRQDSLVGALGAFQGLYDKKIGRVRATVISAVPVSDEILEDLRSRTAKTLGKEVLMETEIDESMLGGLVVRCDGLVADGSLRTSLKNIRAEMLSVKLGSELVHEN